MNRFFSILLSVSMILSMFPAEGIAAARTQALGYTGEVVSDRMEEVLPQEEQPSEELAAATPEQDAAADEPAAQPVGEEAASDEAAPSQEPAPAPEAAPEEDPIPTSDNLRDFTKEVTIADVDKVDEAYPVEPDKDYTVKLVFAEKDDKQLADDKELTLTLPEGFTPAEEQPALKADPVTVTVRYFDEASEAEDHLTRFPVEAKEWKIEDGVLHITLKQRDDEAEADREDFTRLTELSTAELELELVGTFAAGTSELDFGNDENQVILSLQMPAAEEPQPADEQPAPADQQDDATPEETPAEEATPQASEAEVNKAKKDVFSLFALADSYSLQVRFVDSSYNDLNRDQIAGIDLSKISVHLTDATRGAVLTQPITINEDGKASYTITDFGGREYVSGDNVTSVLVYNGAHYAGGSTIGLFDVIIQDDAQSGSSVITFKQHRPPIVTVNFLDENDEFVDSHFSDQYVLVATLYEKNGTKVGTFEREIDNTSQTQKINIYEFGLGNYLTGDRTYNIEIRHVTDNIMLGDDAVIYWEEYPVSVEISGSRVVSSPNATVNFTRMPSLKVASKLLDERGNPTSTPPGKSYYVLTMATVDNEKFYALTPLVMAASSTDQSQYNGANPAIITSYVTRDNQKRAIYRGGETVEYIVLESDNPNLKITDLTEEGRGTVYRDLSSGQITSEGYLVTIAQDGTLATATLKKMSNPIASDIDVTIKMYGTTGSTPEPADPQIGQDLYMLVTLKPKGDSSGSPLAWSVTPLSNARSQLNSSGTTTFTIPRTFNLAGSDMKATGSTINFDPSLYDFTLRLYRKTGSSDFSGPNAYNEIRNTANAVDTIEGYDFIGTTKAADNKSAVLELHKTYPKSYRVIYNIDPAGLNVEENDYYYLFIEGVHGDSTSYFLQPLVIQPNQTTAYAVVQSVNGNKVTSYWQDNNGNVTPNVSIDGTWEVTPHILKANNPINMNTAIAGTNSVRIDSGQNVNDYIIEIVPTTYSEDSGNRRDYSNVINFTKMNVEPALTPTDILGNAAEYGVTAGRFVQDGHTETNFAVKSFRTNSNIDIDGSGENAIPFLVGTIDEGTRLELTNGMHVDADVYVAEYPDRVYDNTAGGKFNVKVTVYEESKEVLDAQIQNLIDAGLAVSDRLASKTTIAPTSNASQFTLDTTGFPDNCTIYVNADGITNAIAADGGLRINKNPGQSIVFNISKPGTAGNPLRIGEFYVNPNDPDFATKYPGEEEWVKSTTAALDGNQIHNKCVDDVIFEHITFNVTEAEHVHLNNTAGLFLLANADEVTQANGSGWVFAGGSDGQGGTLTSDTEWHFYRHYRRYKARGDFSFHAIKKLVDKDGNEVGFENKNFKFELYRANDAGNYPVSPDETAIASNTGDVYFTSISFTQADIPFASDQDLVATKNFFFKVVEVIPDDAVNNDGKAYQDCTDAEKSSGTFTKDGVVYSAEPIMLRVEATNTRASASATTGVITAEVYLLNESKYAEKTKTDEVTVYNIGNATNKRLTVKTGFNAQKNTDYPWDDESFTFVLTAGVAKDKSGHNVGNSPMPEGSSNGTKSVQVSKSTPKQYFGDIVYTEPGTYAYTITESIPGTATATIDGVEYTYSQAITAGSGVSEAQIEAASWKEDAITFDASKRTITVTVTDGDPMGYTVTEGTKDITSDPTVTMVNKKDQTGSLKLRKIATVDGQPTSTSFVDGTYTFQITGDSNHTVTITISGGKATAATVDGNAATLDADGYVEVESLKAGQYTIEESTSGLSDRGIALVGDNPKTVTVEEGVSGADVTARGKADFTNNLATGGLKIQKVVTENSGAISPGAQTVVKGDYVFTVYTDEELTTPLKDANGNDVTVTITIDGTSSSVTSPEISGVKPGDYWVAETEVPSNGTKAVDSPKKVTVEAGKTGDAAIIATITNNLETGGLKVTKVVRSDVSADHSKKFPIVVELSDKSITGTFGGITFTNGKAEFGLADTESLTATGLPAGISYTVTETLTTDDDKLFTVTWTGNTSGTVAVNKIEDVTVTNARKTGDLNLSKTLLTNSAADDSVEFEFSVSLTEPLSGTYGGATFSNGTAIVRVKGGNSVSITGLPIDVAYTITEKNTPGFTMTGITVNGEAAESAQGTIVQGITRVDFSNRRNPGNMLVTKTVTSSTASDKQKPFSFKVTMYQDAAYSRPETRIDGARGVNGAYGVTFDKGVATFTLKDGESKQIDNLPIGVYYVVEETRVDGFTTYSLGEVGSISTSTAKVDFFNDKEEGGLRVYKRVISPVEGDKAQSKTYPITVELSDTSINETYDDITFVNGVARLNLYNGQVAMASGLPKGITYTVTETLGADDANLFEVTYEGKTGTIGDVVATAGVINTRKPGELDVTKTVTSNQEADKTRPFNFRVTLSEKINGSKGDLGEYGVTFVDGVAEFTLTDGATQKITNLPIGITYTVEEYGASGDYAALRAYTTGMTGEAGTISETVSIAAFTNDRRLTSASVKKIWEDAGNQDGKRPVRLIVDLTVDGRPVSSVTLDASNNWSYELLDLPLYDEAGRRYQYGWAENNIPEGYTLETFSGYDASIKYEDTSLENYTTVLVDDHKPEQVEVEVKKVWDDNDNQDGVITDETTLVVNLLADGEETGKSVTLSKDNDWSDSISGLDKYKPGSVGKEIVYTWSEGALPPEYTLTSTNTVGNTTTLTNSYKPKDTEASIEKVWDDKNDQDAIRPADITMTLYKEVGGTKTKVQDVVLSKDNNWKATVKPLPLKENGQTITYTWAEETIPAGYTLSGSVTSGTLTTITNKHIPTPTEMSVIKVWRDGENRDQMRLTSLTVSLMRVADDGSMVDTGVRATLSEANNWRATVTGLDKFDQGKLITYVWTEPDIPGYSLIMSYDSATLQTLTNVHIVKTTEATVRKVWDVLDVNRYRIPQSLRVALLANGVATGEVVTLSEGNNWEATVTGLFENENGTPINYTWSEEDLPAGFVLTNTDKTGTITTLTNSLSDGDLVISKKVVSDVPADKTATYTFTITLGDKSINGIYGDATFTNGEATVQIVGEDEAEIKGLPVNTEYAITEAAVNNMVTEVTGATGTISEDKQSITGTITEVDSAAEFTNTRETGNLRVSKKLISDATADKTRDYVIHIKLADETVEGTFSGVEFTAGKATISLRGGAFKLIEGLPAGVAFTITEDSVPGMATGITDDGEGIITANTLTSVEVTNTRDKGGFILNKALISDLAADKDQLFTFTIVLSDTNINGSYGDVYFNRGRATARLKGEQNVTVSDLPVGITYTITEADATGFELVGITVDGEKADAATGVIAASAPAIVFTNERTPGDLNVHKYVTSSTASDHTKQFEFTVTLTGLTDEAADATYDGKLVTYDENQQAVSTVDRAVTFTDGVATFTLTDRQMQTITGLPTGVDYEVTEEDVESQGFAAPVMTDTTGTISSTPSDAVILNTRTEGALVVYKQVDPTVVADQEKEFAFTVRLYDADGNVDTSVNQTYDGVKFTNGVSETITLKAGTAKYIEGLPLGKEYTVVEDLSPEDAALYDLTWSGETTMVDADGNITTDGTITAAHGLIAKGAVAMAGAKNTRKPGKLTITKAVISDADLDKNTFYTFTVELLNEDDSVASNISGTYGDMVFKNGVATVEIDVINGDNGSATAKDLPLGIKYRVTEVAVDGMVTTISDATGTVSEDGTSVTGAISANGEKATFTNERVVGGFDVEKHVISSTQSDHTKEFTFTVTLSDTTINGDTGAKGAYGVEFTNGVATFTLKDGETKQIRNLPVGIEYIVEESYADGFLTSVNPWHAPGYTISGSVTPTLTTAPFYNNRIEGTLSVRKAVFSDVPSDLEVNKTFSFVVKMYTDDTYTTVDESFDGMYNATYGQWVSESEYHSTPTTVTFTDGVSNEFTLSANDNETISGLPAGRYYTVTETLTDEDGSIFVQKWSGNTTDDGTSAAGRTIRGEASALVNNSRKPGELDVTKHVESHQASDSTRQFNFKVTLSAPINGTEGINGAYGVKFTDGVAEFTLTDGQTQKITNLPVGVTYTVEEYAAGGDANALNAYTSTVEGTGTAGEDGRSMTGTISETVSQATFTNKRTETEASVKKVWVDNEDQDGLRPLVLFVGFMAQSGDGDETVVSVAALTSVNDWSQTYSNLPTHDDAGNPITYRWSEGTIPGYTLTGDVTESTITTLTNTHIPEVTKKNVIKVWNDNNNQDGERPQSLTVALLADGTKVDEVVLTADNDWAAEIDNLPKYKDHGKLIVYEWSEEDLPETYALTGTVIRDDSTMLTNTHNPEVTERSVEKIWVDNDNQDGLRPEQLVVTLSKTVGDVTEKVEGTYTVNGVSTVITGGKVTLNEDNEWHATVEGLPFKEGGTVINYSWDEEAIAQYESDVVVRGTLTTFTNTHKPQLVDAKVIKVWADASNQDGIRPATIVVALMKSVEGKEGQEKLGEITLNISHASAANPDEWSFTITDLPAFEDHGKKITYSWVEESVPEGYTLTSADESTADAFITSLTNAHTPDKTEATVKKVWENVSDANKSKMPSSLHVVLLANGVATDEVVTLSEGNNWEATVTGLDKFAAGKEIAYTWSEEDLPAGFVLTNTKTEGTITTLTNKFVTGDLDISKKVISDVAADKSKIYTFTVELSDTSIAGTYGAATFTAGKATVEITGESMASITGLPAFDAAGNPVTYTVTEVAVDNMTTTVTGATGTISPDKQSVTGTITDAAKSSAEFTNERDKGNIEVSKEVISDLTADKTRNYVFTVTLYRDADHQVVETGVTGVSYSGVTFTNGAASFTLRGGQSKLIEGLPAGLYYTVTEATVPGIVTGITGGSSSVVKGETAEVAVTNTRDKGGFTLSKKLISDRAADASLEFTFNITLSDRNISGTFGDVPFQRGRATVKLTGGASAKVEDLPVGITYTITEVDVPGFDMTGITVDDKDAEAAAGTIELNKKPAIVFTNERIPGDLLVYKFVRSATDADHNRPFEFKVTVEGLANPDATFEGKLMTVTTDGIVTDETDSPVTFKNGVATIYLKDTQAQSITGLPTEVTYKVEETSVPGFNDPASTDAEGIITEVPSSAVFLNTRTQGGLVVYKQVDPTVAADQEKEFTFTVRLYDEDGNVDTTINQKYGEVEFENGVAHLTIKAGASQYIEGLPLGKEYTVTEDLNAEDAALYDLTWSVDTVTINSETGAIDPAGDTEAAYGTVARNTVAMVGAKNTRKPGKLTITKAVISDADIDRNATYTFTVELSDKTISGTFGDMVFKNGVATVDIEVKDGKTESKTAEKLPVGIGYTVSEVAVDGMVTTISDATGTVSEDGTSVTGTISANGEKATFTNERAVGGFDVEKHVISSTQSDHTKEFTFTVTLSDTTINGKVAANGKAFVADDPDFSFANGVATFTLKDGETKTIENLPIGITYHVEEETDTGFRTTTGSIYGPVTHTTPELTVGEDDGVSFYNSRTQGHLSIRKEVRSDVASESDPNNVFYVTITMYNADGTVATHVDGTYGEIEFTQGKAENLAVNVGRTKYAYNLPAGLTYTVVEELTDEQGKTYTVSWFDEVVDVDGEPGVRNTIAPNVIAPVVVFNTHKPGELDVTKLVDSFLPTDNTRKFNFRVTLSEPINGTEGVNGAYGVEFTDGVAEFTLTKDQTQKITNLPVGITYTVEEYAAGGDANALTAYTTGKTGDTGTISETVVSQATFTNKRIPTKASVVKVWNDANNQDGTRPNVLHVNLTAKISGSEDDPVAVSTVTLDESNGWKAEVTPLPAFDDSGNAITYGWQESVPEGYSVAYATDPSDATVTTITNTYVPMETWTQVYKDWDDNNNQDGVRPESITMFLYGDDDLVGTYYLDESSHWYQSVQGLPMYKNGHEISYRWVEDESSLPEGYVITSMGSSLQWGEDDYGRSFPVTSVSITNSYKPKEIEASVQKRWDDANNQDGIRPETLVMTLSKTVDSKTELISGEYTLNGVPTTITDGKVELNAANSWAATVVGLPMFEDGKQITYSWDETAVPEGYTFVKADDLIVTGTLTTITNHHIPELTKANVVKVWDDDSNRDGMRPFMLVVALMKQVEGETEAREVERVTLNATMPVGSDTNKWTYEVKDLPAFQDGKRITYFWVEWDLPIGYELVKTDQVSPDDPAAGYVTTLTNFHKPEQTKVTVIKAWGDVDDQDGVRPDSLTVTLLANGAKTSNVKVLNEGNDWSAVVENLFKYENGKEIEYSWSEDDLPAEYTLTNTATEIGMNAIIVTLTNTHVPEETEASLRKVWDDADDQDAIRPDELVVKLLADGKDSGLSVTLSEDTNWFGHIGRLPKYRDHGVEIVYAWSEEDVPEGYVVSNTTTEGTVTTITNRHKPDEVEVEVKKVWDDDNNRDAIRPDSLTVTLLADGVEIDSVTLNEANKWAASVSGLPKNKVVTDEDGNITDTGVAIVYTWAEDDVPEGYVVSNVATAGYVTTITNRHVPEVTEVSVKKVWDDANNRSGVRPASLKVNLLANGVATGKSVTLTEANGWSASLGNLPKNENGVEVAYTWREEVPSGYVLSGMTTKGGVTTITNKYTPPEIPKTDDVTNFGAIYALAVVGMLSVAVGVTQRRRPRRR